MSDTNDGLSGYSASIGRGDDVDIEAMAKQFAQQMGDAKSIRPDKRARIANNIYNLVGASSKADKKLTDYALAYLFTVHGASMNVQWSEVDLIPGGGTRKVNMVDIIHLIGTDAGTLRKFAIEYSALAIELHDSSEVVRSKLRERAVRSGLPMTETKAMIDFVDLDRDNPHSAGLRVQAKYSAVARAEANTGENSLGKASRHAANRIDNAAVLRPMRRDEDSLGPI